MMLAANKIENVNEEIAMMLENPQANEVDYSPDSMESASEEFIDVEADDLIPEDEINVVEEYEIPITNVLPVRQGSVIESSDFKFKFDLNPEETVGYESLDEYVVWNEWKNETLVVYLNRPKETPVYGIVTMRMTNRKSNEKTIGQMMNSFNAEQQTTSISFSHTTGFFTQRVQIEISFELIDEEVNILYYPTQFKSGTLLLREDEIVDLNLGEINWPTMDCFVTQDRIASDCYEYFKLKEQCENLGFSADLLIKCNELSRIFDMSFLKMSQEEILQSPLSVLEFLIIAEKFGLDQVTYEALSKLDCQVKIKQLAVFAKYLGPNSIKLLVEKFKMMDNGHSSAFDVSEIAPYEESSIMKAIRIEWPAKTDMKNAELQECVDSIVTPLYLTYNRMMAAEDGGIVLKKRAEAAELARKRKAGTSCSHPLENNLFDVSVKQTDVIKFTIWYSSSRMSTLWEIDAKITFLLTKIEENHEILWEYNTQHKFSWNNDSLVVAALTTDTLQKNYNRPVGFEVRIEILTNEGFVNVKMNNEKYCLGVATFLVDGENGVEKVAATNRSTSMQSAVLRTLIHRSSDNIGKQRKRVRVPGVTYDCLKRIFNSFDANKNMLANLDYTERKNFPIPVVARLLQYSCALSTILESLKTCDPTSRFVFAELYGFDDLQLWSLEQIQTIEDFNEIDISMLQDRSIAALFSTLPKF